MPCDNTLEPAVGCRGPGTPTACDFCRNKQLQKEKKEQKKPVPPPRKDPQPRQQLIGQSRPPLPPSVAKQMVAETGGTATAILIAQPQQMRCPKLPPLPPPPKPLVDPSAPPVKPQPLPRQMMELPPPPKPKLVTLEVQGACGGPGTWWQVVSADRVVKVKAVTAPDIKWAWNQLSWGTNLHEVALTAASPNVVRCSLDGAEQSVMIAVYDLTGLAVSHGVNTGNSWKLYESNAEVTVTATTNPAQDACWSKLQWKAENGDLKPGGAANLRKVSLMPAREMKVNVTLGCSPELGQKKLSTTLRICRWPLLEVTKIFFSDARTIANDGVTEIGKLFDRRWESGRPDPAPKKVTSTMQSPLRYPMSSGVTLEAELKVARKPTEAEQVWVYAKTTVKGFKLEWQAQVTVGPLGAPVTFPATLSTGVLPDEVGKFDAMQIQWFMSNSEGTGWEAIGTTKHLLYVTLADRIANTDPYWTLLDISCKAAAGTKTADELVPKAFEPFATHVGDGKGFQRMGDEVELSYYIKGVDTDADDWNLPNSPYHTKGILSRPDGTGRCGGWADLLKHMYKLHGINSARDFVIIRPRYWNATKAAWEPNYNNRFLVKNCSFGAASLKGFLPYTHVGKTECVKKTGAPGQGKTNPQFDFGDHVYVEYGGKFYDPSYGIGPVDNQFDYEEKAIDGLGAYGSQVPFDQTGTPQHVPNRCSPGYVMRGVSTTTSFAKLAADFQTTEAALLNHPVNGFLKTKRGGDVTKVQAGDVVFIPRIWARKARACMLYGYY